MSNPVMAGFTVRTALVAALTALNSATWSVMTAKPSGEVPATYIVIGSDTADQALDMTQTIAVDGFGQPDGDGIVYCMVASQNEDPEVAMGNVAAAIADMDATCAASLNVYGAYVSAAKVLNAPTSQGSQVRADVEVTYSALP
jgi:hypothetical protein